MKCPECLFENRVGAKFCLDCGLKLERDCPQCAKALSISAKFCDQCGQRLSDVRQPETRGKGVEGERKQVTVLFSDLSGYTVMAEKLDPEEVKEIISGIFGEIAQLIKRYEGFIERFIGDAVMAIFGVPRAHEDDPVRAIRAAIEIHKLVENLGPTLKARTGLSLSMHSGINTGLVVTGEVNLDQGTHGLTGDAINTASRLQGLARAGEILVGYETYRQAEGFFKFEEWKAQKVKGKETPVIVYRMISPMDKPVTVHRLSGMRAELIGRKAEMAQLGKALQDLREGKGSIFSICGDAGTGKSRLVEEFKTGLDGDDIQWLEGHAYAYSKNIPYFPLIDLLNRIFHIREEDHPGDIREKVERGVGTLLEKPELATPYIGNLYSLSYAEVEDVSPEFWKAKLGEAVRALLAALARKAPTVFFLEDLHWADPSFIEMLQISLLEIRQPAIVLCVFRPTFSLFKSRQVRGLERVYKEIRLKDLSSSEAQEMLASLIKSDQIPFDLRRLVQEKAEGNPFYLEELVNSLMESGSLIKEKDSWMCTGSILDIGISSSLQGIIGGRLDRLDRETKRLLQEASVIGRSFLYEILKRITDIEKDIDQFLTRLQQLDLIRARSLQPDLEYIFKHALTQEVAYNSLLKKGRQEIHERIGHIIENLFRDRLSEFYERLAFHFKRGRSTFKAIDYLMRSAEKSIKRYAVEEAHKYYSEAYSLLAEKGKRTREEDELLIDIITSWAYAFYYRGDLRGLTELLKTHEELARSLEDKARLGMFYAWFGYAAWGRERLMDSYRYLMRAIELGEETGSKRVVGYACAWLSMTCAEMGLLKEAVLFGQRGKGIARSMESDHSVYFLALSGMGQAYWYKGERKSVSEVGEALLEHGQKTFNTRSIVTGYYNAGHGYFIAGDFQTAAEFYQKAIQSSVDPYYSQFPKTMLCYSYLSNGQLKEAKETIQEALTFHKDFGVEIIGTPSRALLGLALISEGNLSRGVGMVEKARRTFLQQERRCLYALSEYTLGKIYLTISVQTGQIKVSSIINNLGFLTKTLPWARRKAENHFRKSIEISEEIGANSMLGMAYLDLGLLDKRRGRTLEARKNISRSIQFLTQCEAGKFLEQARAALKSLEG